MNNKKKYSTSDLLTIPGVGKSIAQDLHYIGIKSVAELKGQDPEELYRKLNQYSGKQHDRCILYVFRLAIYFAEHKNHDPEKLKWWNWKDKKRTKLE